jgi:signal transduction histidine kinase
MTIKIEDAGQGNLKQSSLDEELLKIIASQVKSSPYAICLAMGIIAYMIYRHIPEQPLLWGGWMSLVILTQAYRVYRLPKLPLETHIPIRRRTREAALMNIIGIGIQSLSLIAFPLFTPFEASVQTMMFVGMGVGSIVTAVGWAPYILSHIWLTLIPAYSLWLWSGLYGPSGTVGTLVAIVGYAYALTMWIISKRLFKMHKEFFANRSALAIALENAEAAGNAKTRFLASASHDLRQPIHALSMSSATLAMGDLDHQTREISNTITTAVNALSSQLDALLDISKLDAGIVPVQLSQVSLSGIIKQLCVELEDAASANTISFQVNCPADAQVHTDPGLFKRVASNIVSNTISHNTNCHLYIVAQEKTDHWELEIRDTGTGIAPEEHRHVFEEFYQVQNPERDRSKGLGTAGHTRKVKQQRATNPIEMIEADFPCDDIPKIL